MTDQSDDDRDDGFEQAYESLRRHWPRIGERERAAAAGSIDRLIEIVAARVGSGVAAVEDQVRYDLDR